MQSIDQGVGPLAAAKIEVDEGDVGGLFGGQPIRFGDAGDGAGDVRSERSQQRSELFPRESQTPLSVRENGRTAIAGSRERCDIATPKLDRPGSHSVGISDALIERSRPARSRITGFEGHAYPLGRGFLATRHSPEEASSSLGSGCGRTCRDHVRG